MIDDARLVIDEAIRGRVFPAATVEVGTSAGATWRHAAGTLTFDPDAAPAEISTPFDLASLTKVISTTTIVMDLVAAGRLRLDERLADSFAEWRGADRASVTVRDVLEHAAGLPARLVVAPPESRREFEHEICAIPLEYAPRTRSIYSDLGFILLGFLAADRGAAPLAEQFDAVMARLSRAGPQDRPPDDAFAQCLRDLAFGLRDPEGPRRRGDTEKTVGNLRVSVPPWRSSPGLAGRADFHHGLPDARRRAAPTRPMDDDARRGRMLMGDVHDNYAAALGGAAGHAGLFGTAPAVGAFGCAVLRAARGDDSSGLSPALVTAFIRKTTVPGSSRALGWDTMLPTSSCGVRMTASAFGHVGFTGTSLWIDPERDRYFVLLTNRVCDGGSLGEMREVRRAFHDALGTY